MWVSDHVEAKLEFDAAEATSPGARTSRYRLDQLSGTRRKRGSLHERSSMDRNRRFVQLHDRETMERLRSIDRVEELVAEGRSRLTAQRIVEIERGRAEAGRARRHPLSR